MKNLLKNKKLLAAVAIALIVALLVPVLVFAATTFSGTDQSPVGVAGTLKFQGSTTVGPIVVRTLTDYNSFRGTTVINSADIIQNGSGNGRQGAILHYTDIGMSSSNLSTTPGSGIPVWDGAHWIFGNTSTGYSEADVLND